MPNEDNITHDYIIDYVRSSLAPSDGIFSSMEDFAEVNNIPIVQKEVASFLETVCLIHKPMRILEIGTAIGYSAMLMMKNLPENAHITTIERDEAMLYHSKKNIKLAGMEGKITVVSADAEEYLKSLDESFDMIFMDAAKSHYIYFLPECIRLLKSGGVLISDNVLYGGMVANNDLLIRRKITIVKRLRKYIDALCSDKRLKTSLLSIGDGVSFSYKY